MATNEVCNNLFDELWKEISPILEKAFMEPEEGLEVQAIEAQQLEWVNSLDENTFRKAVQSSGKNPVLRGKALRALFLPGNEGKLRSYIYEKGNFPIEPRILVYVCQFRFDYTVDILRGSFDDRACEMLMMEFGNREVLKNYIVKAHPSIEFVCDLFSREEYKELQKIYICKKLLYDGGISEDEERKYKLLMRLNNL